MCLFVDTAAFPCSVYQNLGKPPQINPPLSPLSTAHHQIQKRSYRLSEWKLNTIIGVAFACLVAVLVILLLFMAISTVRKRTSKNTFPPPQSPQHSNARLRSPLHRRPRSPLYHSTLQPIPSQDSGTPLSKWSEKWSSVTVFIESMHIASWDMDRILEQSFHMTL